MHREYSGTFPARIIIEKERIITENWNRSLQPGRITLENLNPYPKNPILARFFVNIGYADTLGSGVRNLYRYTKIYSGGDPELLEGDIFKTIVPLLRDGSVSDDVSDVSDDETGTLILRYIKDNPNITYNELAQKTVLVRRTVQRHIQNLKKQGCLRRIGSERNGHWEIIEKLGEKNP
jgi:ATP-dependent DNA helicase RecG